ncbi:hypothetical protein BDP55DRAFT_545628, partial [Colletotrichum godetiae]
MADTAFRHQAIEKRQPLRPGLKFRRFGRQDFERFDQEKACGPYLPGGSSASVGKVKIDCMYKWRKAQWGVLGSNKQPAGIVYIDMTIRQPQGHTLSNATIFITLADRDASRVPIEGGRSRRHGQPSRKSDHAVSVTEFLGPQNISGPKTITTEVRERDFEPTLGFGGMAELGGMGTHRSMTREVVNCWTFKGVPTRPKDGEGFRSLQWDFVDSEVDSNPSLPPTFHTGFAFEHKGRPITMCVEVEGRLKSKMQQTRHGMKFLRFRSKSKDTDNSTAIEIDLSSAASVFKNQLDGVAGRLNEDMKTEMDDARAVEMPLP